jgi:hypothetical protein
VDLVFSETDKEGSVECKDMFWNTIESICKEKREEVKKVRDPVSEVNTKPVPEEIFVIDVKKEEPARYIKVVEEDKVAKVSAEEIKKDNKEVKESEINEKIGDKKETDSEKKEVQKEEAEQKAAVQKEEVKDINEPDNNKEIDNKKEPNNEEEVNTKDKVESKEEENKEGEKNDMNEEDVDKLLARLENEVNS